MTKTLPPESLVAIATLVAALVTAALSFVTMTLTKELKTSEFRQTWIDGLRQELAAFFGAARAFARAVEASQSAAAAPDGQVPLGLTAERISDLRYQAGEMLSKIMLRLNPNKEEHVELLRLLRRAIDEQNSMLTSGAPDASPTIKAIEAANEYARPVLKKEWERVKKGEPPFRLARNWLAPGVIVLSIAFIWWVGSGGFGAQQLSCACNNR
jgi:hypothetical protein